MHKVLGRFIAIALAALLAGTALGAQKPEPAPSGSQIDSSGFDLYEAGQKEHREGHLDKAIELYDKALEIEPELWHAYYQRGIAFLQLNRPADAEKLLRRATEIEGEIAAPHAALGEALLVLGRGQDAEIELAKALQLDPMLSGARINYAVALWQRKAFVEAERELARVETEKHETADSCVLHGQVLEQLGREKDAAAAYERAIAIDPKQPDAHVFRGRLRAKAGDAAGAIEDLSAAQAVRPDDEIGRELRGLQVRSGNAGDALESLGQQVAAHPDDAAARRAYADALARAGRIDDAKVQLEALTNGATTAETFDFAGDVLLEGDPLDAARYYVQAARLEPDDTGHRLKLGTALVRAGKYQAALEHLRFCVAKAPDGREGHAGLAAALYSTKDYAGAAQEFGWLASHEPDNTLAQYFLGASLDRIGDCQGALTAFERFLSHADAQRDKPKIDEVNLVLPRIKRQLEKGECKKPVDSTGASTKKGG